MNELEKILNEFAIAFKASVMFYAEKYKNTKTNTDTLSNSDIVKNLKVGIENERLVISIYDYWQYIESGRKVGEKMVPISVLIDWIKRKKILGRNKKGQFISVNNLAWAIAKSIQLKGISKRPIFTEAYNETSKEFDKKLNIYIDSITKSILLRFTKK